ncbi:unnamed protein product [Ambrosiozyma monospora]|uniref:Unnamed protein product n=1 Tax=Ambrosiozyma monospora TaxID=43982 RepID=A0ACB5TZN1_AMBMO|nr:unnamed protein product [Ambrosiozyma monospora]
MQQNTSLPQSNWTFEHALFLINTTTTNELLFKELETFLSSNESVLLTPSIPFARTTEQKEATIPDSFKLRSVEYSAKLTKEQKQYINEVSNILKFDTLEVARIVIAALDRIPKDHSLSLNNLNNNSVLVQDSIKRLEHLMLRLLKNP